MSYRCPTNPVPVVSGRPGDIWGCGLVFDAERDEEGLVDCPGCGMWFNPDHPENQETG